MKPTKVRSLRHLFNNEKKDPGPLLIIEAVTMENDEVAIAHKWVGSGRPTREEFKRLCHHLIDQKDNCTNLFSHYILQIM